MANYFGFNEIEMYFNWFLAWDSFEGFLAEFFGGFGAKMLGIIF
jgi:hypothetical protein